ncbi:MAG: BMC domain-containing protein [Treponema sp.]|nr:BMC domain-containing protein [Treponema sp.]
MAQALGIIETQGRVSLIGTLDTAVKSAPVDVLAGFFVGGGCNTATLTGDVGAVSAALDAARAMMEGLGIDGRTHLIARPADQVWPMIAPKGKDIGDGTWN